MADFPLSARLHEWVQEVFPGNEDEIIGILERECGYNLPDMQPGAELRIAEVQTAVLIISEGSKEKLLWAIQQAKTDWRDVLVWGQIAVRRRGLFRP